MTGLKFVVGVGLGLIVGCIVAALLAPKAGEDTRRKLKEMVPTGAKDSDAVSGGTARQGLLDGLVGALKARWNRALAEAKRARAERERELFAEFETAQRSGKIP